MPAGQLSDVLITFKSASNVPIRDLVSKSSDPFLLALLTPRTPPSPEHPPFLLTFRTTTKRETRNPEWNENWHLGGMPPEGFDLRIKICDEDKPGDFDDRLGVAELSVAELPPAGADGKSGEVHKHVLKIMKRKASRRAYTATYLIALCNRDFTKQRGRVDFHEGRTDNRSQYLFKTLESLVAPETVPVCWVRCDGAFMYPI
jgi:hypothetical protein